MKKLGFVLALTLAAPALPITFDELAAIRRIGPPKVSPDGRTVAYHASTIDMPANYRQSAIYLVSAVGGASRKISDGTKQDEEPAWSPDGKTIAYVSNREGGAKQVYLYDVAGGSTRKLTTLDGGASAVKWTPDSSALVLVSDIYPECGVDPTCIKQKTDAAGARPTKARVIDKLFFRRWNAWQEPTRAHIVYHRSAALRAI